MTGRHAIAVRHPVVILLLQLRLVMPVNLIAFMRCQQVHHQAEERRLRPAEIIAAVAVRDMPVAIELSGKVIDHVLYAIPVAALCQAQHGKIAVPVIDLAETSAWHDVRFWQRQQRIILAGIRRTARQHRPQAVDVLTQALPGRRYILILRFGQGEIHINKAFEIEIALLFLHLPVSKYRGRIIFRDRVSKGFLIGIELRFLHGAEERTQAYIGRLRRLAQHPAPGFGMRQRAGCQQGSGKQQRETRGHKYDIFSHRFFSLSENVVR